MTARQRVVIDSNVLISALITSNSVAASAVDRAVRAHQLIFSTPTLDELEAVLRRKKFERYVSLDDRLGYIPRLLIGAEVIAAADTISVCRDPNDNKFLDLAVQGNAQLIISGDDDLLSLHPFLGIPIVSPAEFLTYNE